MSGRLKHAGCTEDSQEQHLHLHTVLTSILPKAQGLADPTLSNQITWGEKVEPEPTRHHGLVQTISVSPFYRHKHQGGEVFFFFLSYLKLRPSAIRP